MSIRIPVKADPSLRDAFYDVEQRLRQLERNREEDPEAGVEAEIATLRAELEELRTRRKTPDYRDIMVASGDMHAPGLVPDPPSTSGTTKFLREDGTWVAVVGGGGTSPLTTKGDIWGYTTTDARVAVGTNDTVLKADSSTASGVIWEKAAASEVTFAATTQISADDVQEAIDELGSTHGLVNIKYVPPGTGTLSTAVAAMSNGDVLVLGAGTYTVTTVDIPDAVTEFAILGSGVGVTIINTTGGGIGINAGDVRRHKAVIQGFTLQPTTQSGTWGIHVWGRSQNSYVNNHIVIRNVSIERSSTPYWWTSGGVRIENCFEAVLENISFRNKPSDYVGVGIQLESSVVCNIISCRVTETSIAFKIMRDADWTRVENAVSGGDAADQYYHGCEGNRFYGCEAYITDYGWWLDTRSLDNVFDSGTLAACRTNGVIDTGASVLTLSGYNGLFSTWIDGLTASGAAGMALIMQGWKIEGNTFNGPNDTSKNASGVAFTADTADRAMVIGNNFRLLDFGIYNNGADSCLFTNNIFESMTANDTGIYIFSGGDNNICTNNQYYNSPGYTDGGSGNVWDYVDIAGDSMTGTLAIAETAGSTRHSALQVVVGGNAGNQNVRIANKKVADLAATYNFWQTPLTVYNDFGSESASGNVGTTGVNTGLRVIAGTDNPAAAEGTPGANSVVGATIFSANGSLVDPVALWGLNLLAHYFRSPNADPASGLYLYGQETEVLHNTASDHVSDPFAAITANNTRSIGHQIISHSDNPKKTSVGLLVDAGGYTLGSGGRAGTNWWQHGIALTRCAQSGILFDVRASEVGTAFATAGIYFKGVPAATNLIRSDLATSSIYLPYAGDTNFNFYNSADQNLYVGIASGDGTPVKTCGVKLYDASTLKWSLLKDTSNNFVVYDNANSNSLATFSADTLTLSSATSDKPDLIIQNTNADNADPQLILEKLSASPADSDELGGIRFRGYNDNASPENTAFVVLRGRALDVSDGTEDGRFEVSCITDGSFGNAGSFTGSTPSSEAPGVYAYFKPITAKYRADTSSSTFLVWDTTVAADAKITVASTTNVTVSEAGTYHVGCNVALTLNNTTANITLYRYNSSNAQQEQTNVTVETSANRSTTGTFSEVYVCAAGDYFKVAHDAGTVTNNDVFNQFSIQRLN